MYVFRTLNFNMVHISYYVNKIITKIVLSSENMYMDFSERLEMIIKAQNMSQKAIAEYMGIRRPSVSDWKNLGTIPGADTAIKLAHFLGVSVEYLITGEDETGLTPEQRKLLRNYAKLDERDTQTVLDLIEAMIKKQKKEEKDMYTDTVPVSFETKEEAPSYPQLVKVHKQSKIDNNAAIIPDYYIPFYGKAAAGRPIDINIPPDRVISVPGPILKGDKSRYFSVEIRGTSMIRAGIKDGDYAIMRRAEGPENGKVMLVRYGNESTVKRIRIEKGRVFLCW